MCGLVGQSAPLAMSCYAALTTVTLLASYQVWVNDTMLVPFSQTRNELLSHLHTFHTSTQTVRCIPLATLNSTRLQVGPWVRLKPG